VIERSGERNSSWRLDEAVPFRSERLLQSPYVLIGTVGQLVEDLQGRRKRWGISYYVIHEPYVDALAPVVARLAGT